MMVLEVKKTNKSKVKEKRLREDNEVKSNMRLYVSFFVLIVNNT